MRRVHSHCFSTTALAALIVALAGIAQDQPRPADRAAAPADPAQSADAARRLDGGRNTGASGQAIVVTGLRRSLQSARNIKRNSTQMVDAIVAEDIGKLPDITVSDTAARIPGIQVDA